MEKIEEKGLQQMEALLQHSTRGVHILFDNQTIAKVLRDPSDKVNPLDVERLKQVQDLLSQLISKKTYNEKVAFLEELEPKSFEILVRTYFNIVENTVRANTPQYH